MNEGCIAWSRDSLFGCLFKNLACCLTAWLTEIIVLAGQTMYGDDSDDLTGMLGKQLDDERKGCTSNRPAFESERQTSWSELTRQMTQCYNVNIDSRNSKSVTTP